jgi:signal transduction histidine kinase
MAPLQLAAQRAAAIGPHSSGVRLPMEGMAKEVLPLVNAINGALDRAHELLTPLAVLRAGLDNLQDETATTLRQDVTVMAEIVTQLLELAEVDSLTPKASEIVDPRDICIEVAAMLAPMAHKENKDIEFIDAETPVRVRCSSRSLTRALRNLVVNALAATPAGTTVTVYLHSDGAIRVVDHGPGIPPDKRDVIFQRFWRGRQGNRPGAGLGLSIVKRFVDTYGGTVEVGDAPGGGAQITVRLPIESA